MSVFVSERRPNAATKDFRLSRSETPEATAIALPPIQAAIFTRHSGPGLSSGLRLLIAT